MLESQDFSLLLVRVVRSKKVGNEFASEELQISRNEQAFKDWVSCIIL